MDGLMGLLKAPAKSANETTKDLKEIFNFSQPANFSLVELQEACWGFRELDLGEHTDSPQAEGTAEDVEASGQ